MMLELIEKVFERLNALGFEEVQARLARGEHLGDAVDQAAAGLPRDLDPGDLLAQLRIASGEPALGGEPLRVAPERRVRDQPLDAADIGPVDSALEG